MRRRELLVWAAMVGLLALAIGVGVLWVGWFRPEREARHHREAMQHWPELVKNGFKGDPQDVATTFYRCFRRWDEVAAYLPLLATATKKEYPGLGPSYRWFWDKGYGGEGDAYFIIDVSDSNPPVIEAVYVSEVCS